MAVLSASRFGTKIMFFGEHFHPTFGGAQSAINVRRPTIFSCDDNDAPKGRKSPYKTTIADLVFYLFNKNPLFHPVWGH